MLYLYSFLGNLPIFRFAPTGAPTKNARYSIASAPHQPPISASQTNENSAIMGAVNPWGNLRVGARLGRAQGVMMSVSGTKVFPASVRTK